MTLLLRAAVAALMLTGWAAPLRAQVQDTAAARAQASTQLGRDVSQSEILERLRASGMTREQVRARLQMTGYDPSMADPYFDAMEGRGTLPAEPDTRFGAAIRTLGIASDSIVTAEPDRFDEDELRRADFQFRADSIMRARTQRQDSIALAQAGITDLGLPLFGRSLFTRRSTEFRPDLAGPVDENYRLGPGDEVDLVLTGDVELLHQLIVDREGYVLIPDVGQVQVNGLTLTQLESMLYGRLGQVYSGVERGGNATTFFHVTVGRMRANQVYVVGEAEAPGAYLVSAAASAFTALYQSGGPSVQGSFRAIEIRSGGEVRRLVDLYDYLLTGRSADDIRLASGDMIFIPLAGARVTVSGQVRRPAVYELRGSEGLREVLSFAGGLRAQAVVERIQISRILPPDERVPGVDRVVTDVLLSELLAQGDPIPLQDGDVITVFTVADETRRFVLLTGGVNRPGTYEWQPQLSLGDVIARADGLREDAFEARAHVFRLEPTDGSRRLIAVPLDNETALALPLNDRDSVVVYSRDALRVDQYVEVSGLVKSPGTFELAQGMTLQDLILSSGGFREGAYELEVEIARRVDPDVRTNLTSRVLRVRLDDQGVARVVEGAGVGEPTANEVLLENGDRVFVRRAPGFEEPRVVVVTGEVAFPGRYVLESRSSRLRDIVQRAGGLTDEAFPEGFQLVRGGHLVGTDLVDVLAGRNDRDNVLLEAGDSLHVPSYDPTVLVTGAVAFETRVLYAAGEGIDYYIAQAGGYTDNADKGRVAVTHLNGEREIVDRVLLFRTTPDVRPGSHITVPFEPDNMGFNWNMFLTQSLAVATTAATLIIAIAQIK